MKINKKYIFMLFTVFISSGVCSDNTDSVVDAVNSPAPDNITSDDNKVVARFDTKKDSTVTCQISPADAVKKNRKTFIDDADDDNGYNKAGKRRRPFFIDEYDDNDDSGRRLNKKRRENKRHRYHQYDDERYDNEDAYGDDYDDEYNRRYEDDRYDKKKRCYGCLDTAQSTSYQAYNPYGQSQAYNPYGQSQAYNPYGQPQAYNSYGQPQAYNSYGQPQAYNSYGQPQAYNPYGQPQAYNPYGQSQMSFMTQNPWIRNTYPGQMMTTQQNIGGLTQNQQLGANKLSPNLFQSNTSNTTLKPDKYTDADGYICKKPKDSLGTRFKNFFGLGKEQRAQYAAQQDNAIRASKEQKIAEAQKDLADFNNPAPKPEKKGALARLKGLLGRG